MTYALLLIAATLLAFAAYVRLAPTDAARWHADPTEALSAAGALALSPLESERKIIAMPGGAVAWVEVLGAGPAALARLDEIALATPRTTRLAGSPEEGRITWVTRSALWGFPDYTTADAITHDVATSELRLFARLRFGSSGSGR
ncbi:MAG: DUF1499 domain-containing protein [Rhodobacteraceae bacterium]|nr:DUF1499 domain-containing protein [Paracoccaceae bacterium]